jgi:hypothetical protein
MFFGKKTHVDRGAARPAEFFHVTSSGLHSRIDCLTERADGSFAVLRLLLTKDFAQKASVALESTIEKYQAVKGHIRVGRESLPEAPRVSSQEERAVNMLKVSYAEDALFLEFALVLNTTDQMSEYDRFMLVSSVGLAPGLLAGLKASLK